MRDKATNIEKKALIKKARIAGFRAAATNSKRPSIDKLKKRHPDYTEELVQAYLTAYDKKMSKIKATGTENKALMNKSRHVGIMAASFNSPRPTENALKSRNPDYTDEQVQAYLNAYDEKMTRIKAKGTENKALIKQARSAGFSAAVYGYPRPTEDAFKTRYPDYTDEQVQAYLNSYDTKSAKMKATGTENKALINKARNAGFVAASKNSSRPTADEIKKRHSDYTDEHVNAYLSSYDAKVAKIKATGTENSALIKKAKNAGFVAALKNISRPTEDLLKKRHPDYSDEEIKAYFSSYDAKRTKMNSMRPIASELSYTLPQLESSEDSIEVESLLEFPQTQTAILYNFARTNAGPSLLNNNNAEEVAFVFSPLSRAGI